MLVLVIGGIGFVISKAGLSIAPSFHLLVRPCGLSGVFVDLKLPGGCGGIVVIVIGRVIISSSIVAIIVVVVREVGLLAGLWVVIGRLVVQGLILLLAGVGCAYGLGVGWLLVLVVMLVMLLLLLWRGG